MSRMEQLNELTDPANADLLTASDVSDKTSHSEGTAKRVQMTTLGLPPAYGELTVEGNASELTISGTQSDFGANAVQVTSFDTNGESSNSTPDHTNDHITIDVAGTYLIQCSLSFSNGSSDTISFAFFKNNKDTQLGTRGTRKLGTGGDVGNAGLIAIATLAVGDTVEIWIQNEAASANILIEDGSLQVIRIG